MGCRIRQEIPVFLQGWEFAEPSITHPLILISVSRKTAVYGDLLNCQEIRETRVALRGVTVGDWLACEGGDFLYLNGESYA